MSDEDNITTLAIQEEQPKLTVDFLRKSQELSKMVKDLDKPNKEAIKVLVQLMQTSDDPNIQFKCAAKITDLYQGAVKEKVSDELTKMVAQARQLSQGNGGMKQLVEEKEAKPKVVIDFTTVKTLG